MSGTSQDVQAGRWTRRQRDLAVCLWVSFLAACAGTFVLSPSELDALRRVVHPATEPVEAWEAGLHPDVVQAVLDATDGRGVDVAIEAASGGDSAGWQFTHSAVMPSVLPRTA